VDLTDAAVSLPAAVIFSLEMVGTFFTGLIIVNRMRRALVMDHKMVALHYVLHGTFLLDLAVTASLWAEVTMVCHRRKASPIA
jgi:hypothetical protein